MVEMELTSVRVEMPTNTPVVLLQEIEGAHRTLPIFIGAFEASSIAEAIQGVERPRPMTHDLMRDLLVTLGVKVDHVVITDLRDGTFFAEIRMSREGRSYVLSARPSDAMALASRIGAKIYADEALLDAEGVILQPDDIDDEAANPDELVSEFRDFIEGIRPEDFGS